MKTASLTAYADAEAINAALVAALRSRLSQGTFRLPAGSVVPCVGVSSLVTTLSPRPFEWASADENIGFSLHVTIFEIPIPLEIAGLITTEAISGDSTQIVIKDPRVHIPEGFQREIEAYLASEPTDPDHKGLTVGVLRGIVEHIAPALVDLVVKLKPIQVHQLYGSDLQAMLLGVSVVRVGDEYMLRTLAKMARDHGTEDAALELRAEMMLPRKEPTTKFAQAQGKAGRIILLVSQGAFTLIAQDLLKETRSIDEKEWVLGTKVAIKSKVTIERIKIRIPSKTAKARAKLNFKQTHARVRFGPLQAWTPVEIKSARALVSIKLFAEEGGPDGYVVFKGIDELEVRLKQRYLLDLTAPLLDGVLDEALLPVLNVLFDGARFELLHLPKTLPGPGEIPIDIEFQRRGLQFWPGMALFQLSIDAPPGTVHSPIPSS